MLPFCILSNIFPSYIVIQCTQYTACVLQNESTVHEYCARVLPVASCVVVAKVQYGILHYMGAEPFEKPRSVIRR